MPPGLVVRSGAQGTLMSVGVPVISMPFYLAFGRVMCGLGLPLCADTG